MNLVYVHLGPAECEHLLPSLTRTHELFPEYRIHLVVSPEYNKSHFPEFLESHEYIPTSRIEGIFQKLAHDTNFRQGFWRYSLERLFAIKIVHEKYPYEPLLHIESDILLLPNFPISEIARSQALMWNLYNNTHDVSALLFSPSLTQTDELAKLIEVKIRDNPSLTDMTVLNEICRQSNLEVRHFSSTHMSLPEMINTKAEQIDQSDESLGYGGIFDGAAIGMWLLGHDPKNNYGKSIIHSNLVIENGNSYVDPSTVNYELDENGNLFASSKLRKNSQIPIWNLHVHSKDLTILGADWHLGLKRYVELASSPLQIVKMNWRVLWRMFITSVKTKTFLRFVLGIPILQPLRRRISPIKKMLKSITSSLKAR